MPDCHYYYFFFFFAGAFFFALLFFAFFRLAITTSCWDRERPGSVRLPGENRLHSTPPPREVYKGVCAVVKRRTAFWKKYFKTVRSWIRGESGA
jgi:hypothetical protein